MYVVKNEGSWVLFTQSNYLLNRALLNRGLGVSNLFSVSPLKITQWVRNFLKFQTKNSKVFEQKGDLLNFKANIDPMAVLSQAEPS